jgi:GalNAc-alpha-(1->4)-GalNAc-alpha-(1->3)-diNAcBac-PP-undecaprenol alpha-1,4-N-acetyl-D-galactosaminyltransferase
VADFFSKQSGIKRDRVMVINNGIDLNIVKERKAVLGDRNMVKKELGYMSEDKIILNIARLKPQKNHQLLIQSFEKFSKKNNNFKLLILSLGSEKENLEQMIKRLNLGDKVFLLGYRDEAFKYYYIADMFVLTSKIEGFPNVFLEAMAYGVPVVTTKVAGTEEIMREGKNGFIVESTIDSVAEKMELVSRNHGQYVSACLETAERFDIKKIVWQYEELINSLLK